MAWNTPFAGSVFEPEYAEEDRIFDEECAKEDMINDYLAEQEWEEEQLRQNYSEIEYEEAEIRNLIKGGEAR